MNERDYATTMEDLAFLDDAGTGATEAARRADFSTAEAMEKWLARHGHRDLWQRMKRRDPAGTHTAVNRRKAAEAETTRVCTLCGTEKPITEFYEQAAGRGGRASHCRTCNNVRPPTEIRMIRNRARSRAYAELAKRHAGEFARLYDAEFQKATAEHAEIQRAAAGQPDAAVARLKRGPKRRGETSAVERLDVARCPSCETHHDADHECPGCGATTPAQPIPDSPPKPWQVREWAREHGYDVPLRGPIPTAVQGAYDDHHAQEAS